VDVTATLDAPCSPVDLYDWVVDLGRYPRWLEIEGDEPAWKVDLRGRLGPFARSKRLRMVRTVDDAPTHVVFERRERDGRSHSPWLLEATVAPVDSSGSSTLTMHLHYGGGLWGPVLERMLTDEIAKSKPRLLALLNSRK
jgi:hypothetical protein